LSVDEKGLVVTNIIRYF